MMALHHFREPQALSIGTLLELNMPPVGRVLLALMARATWVPEDNIQFALSNVLPLVLVVLEVNLSLPLWLRNPIFDVGGRYSLKVSISAYILAASLGMEHS